MKVKQALLCELDYKSLEFLLGRVAAGVWHIFVEVFVCLYFWGRAFSPLYVFPKVLYYLSYIITENTNSSAGCWTWLLMTNLFSCTSMLVEEHKNLILSVFQNFKIHQSQNKDQSGAAFYWERHPAHIPAIQKLLMSNRVEKCKSSYCAFHSCNIHSWWGVSSTEGYLQNCLVSKFFF